MILVFSKRILRLIQAVSTAFSNVAPGDYYLEFTGLPAGFQFTLDDQGGDDTS